MSAHSQALRRAGLLAALLLAASAWFCARAGAATVEHQQVVAGLHSATLEARIDPEGTATGCQAEYVSEAGFEAGGWGAAESVACEPGDLGSGTEPVATSAELAGLSLSTAYRYRFLLTAAEETTPAGEGEFSTFGIEIFTFATLDSVGEPDTQAGSHPYELVAKIATPTTAVESGGNGKVAPTGTIKDLLNELPPGLIGNPTALARCSVRTAEENQCGGDAQVGVLEVRYGEKTDANPAEAPLYNTIPPQGTAARFTGEVNGSTDAFIDSGVRTGGDYGITSGGLNISGRANPVAITVRLWGVPADPSHDADRVCGSVGNLPEYGCASTAPELPFLRNPTACGGPLAVRARLDAYQGPGEFDEASATLPAIVGCDELAFEPTIEVRPTSEVADSPTGLHVDLHVPQNEDPEGLATPDLREAVVALPPGFTLNPSSANGLEGCTPTQFGLTTPVGVAPIHTTAGAAECPDAAKIGTVEVDTPLLDHPLPGAIYVAEPYQNPFGSLLAIYIAVDDRQSGVVIKLAGHVEIGAEGQLTTTFSENPQLPFEDFKLDFFGGDLAALKTPSLCGSYETTSTLTPWSAPESGPAAAPSDSHAVTKAPAGGSCPTAPADLPNAPSFEAGSESPIAGAFSPFVMHLRREDGSQQFSALTVTPPPGLLGRLAGIPYCSDAALAAAGAKSGIEEREAPSCPEASRVGTVVVGAGAGAKPYYTTGRAYLAGPYKGAPLSLAIITPAVAGPYDLGTVVVRAALQVDPRTARITVESDPIPTELKGIPLDVRSIAVKMDRPEFTLNPTSCKARSVSGSVISTLGQAVSLSNRFEVGECSKLKFKPDLKLALKGGTRRTKHPALKSVLTFPEKGAFANVKKAIVTLPHSEILDQNHVGNPCTRPQFAEGECPKISILGRAKAWSPLLDKPLEGNVYFRSNGGERDLPDIVADLRGQIHIELIGAVDTASPNRNARIRTTFFDVPDAPVSRFQLELKGGKEGLLVNSDNLCRSSQRAVVNLHAQNGRRRKTQPTIANSCGKKGKGTAKRHSRGR